MSAPRDDESGFTLIEVLVSALLVLAIAGGALAALGSADASSGSQRAHSVASAVAEQALEGLRSQSPTKLMDYVGSPPSLGPITQNKITYQRAVTATWKTEQA